MSGKRGNNEGSIYAFRGGWAAAVSLPGRRRKVMYGRSREQVRRLLAEALAARESGTLAHARGMSVGSFMDLWLAEVAKPSVRPWTFKGYEVHVRLHLKPSLGRLASETLQREVEVWTISQIGSVHKGHTPDGTQPGGSMGLHLTQSCGNGRRSPGREL